MVASKVKNGPDLTRTERSRSVARRQGGSIIVMMVFGLVALVAMLGFVADLGHLYVDKTRLQNALDAAALSAAMTLNAEVDCSDAVTAGNATLAEMQATNADLDHVANLTWTFSATLSPVEDDWETSGEVLCNPVDPDAPSPHFVRVEADLPGLPVFFLRIPGFPITKETEAAAVAGPTGCPTNVVPLGACATDGMGGTATPHRTCDLTDPDCYGYQVNQEYCVKPGAASSSGGKNSDWECGAGDLSGWFNWVAVGGKSGASHIADELAYEASPTGAECLSLYQPIKLESGNIAASNVRDVFNDRLDPRHVDPSISAVNRRKLANCWRGDLGYLLLLNQLTLNGITPNTDNCIWDEAQLLSLLFNTLSFVYQTSPKDNPYDPLGLVETISQLLGTLQYSTKGPSGTGWGKSLFDGYATFWQSATAASLNERTSPRLLVIPVLDCSNATNPSATPPLIGYMCGFITRAIPKAGMVGVKNRVTMEFLRSCGQTRRTPVRIILYKDPLRGDA